MENLFSVEAASSYQSLLLRDPVGCPGLLASFHRASLLSRWAPLEFEFRAVDKRRPMRMPDICTIYARGVLAFRSEVKEALFPAVHADGLEFLPIRVGAGTEPWLLLNCLNTVTAFDEKKSQAVRAMNGDIAMMRQVTIVDPMARRYELFTLAQSQRTQLFALSGFKARVDALRLKGMAFRRVGEVAAAARSMPSVPLSLSMRQRFAAFKARAVTQSFLQ